MTQRLRFRSTQREQLIDITNTIREHVGKSGVAHGVAHLWSLHTTCSLTVNEGADPDVKADMVSFLGDLIPVDGNFDHAEGNSDAHLKTSLFGPGLTLLIENGEPLLGTWQSIYLAEWDGPRERTIAIQIVAAS
ncbi:MAG TPA: secondary thiamine-phosphate synthase enzyme YjbQ [Longimicrobiales bacterium]